MQHVEADQRILADDRSPQDHVSELLPDQGNDADQVGHDRDRPVGELVPGKQVPGQAQEVRDQARVRRRGKIQGRRRGGPRDRVPRAGGRVAADPAEGVRALRRRGRRRRSHGAQLGVQSRRAVRGSAGDMRAEGGGRRRPADRDSGRRGMGRGGLKIRET